jgi:uncharacterized alkaline shock family protein YloU
MAQAVYHYIENYSNVGKIGIAYNAISDMLKEAIKDIEHVTFAKGISCETSKDKVFNVNVSIKVDYGTNVNAVSKEIQNRIENALVHMCEIKNSKINIKLEGINVNQ